MSDASVSMSHQNEKEKEQQQPPIGKDDTNKKITEEIPPANIDDLLDPSTANGIVKTKGNNKKTSKNTSIQRATDTLIKANGIVRKVMVDDSNASDTIDSSSGKRKISQTAAGASSSKSPPPKQPKKKKQKKQTKAQKLAMAWKPHNNSTQFIQPKPPQQMSGGAFMGMPPYGRMMTPGGPMMAPFNNNMMPLNNGMPPQMNMWQGQFASSQMMQQQQQRNMFHQMVMATARAGMPNNSSQQKESPTPMTDKGSPPSPSKEPTTAPSPPSKDQCKTTPEKDTSKSDESSDAKEKSITASKEQNDNSPAEEEATASKEKSNTPSTIDAGTSETKKNDRIVNEEDSNEIQQEGEEKISAEEEDKATSKDEQASSLLTDGYSAEPANKKSKKTLSDTAITPKKKRGRPKKNTGQPPPPAAAASTMTMNNHPGMMMNAPMMQPPFGYRGMPWPGVAPMMNQGMMMQGPYGGMPPPWMQQNPSFGNGPNPMMNPMNNNMAGPGLKDPPPQNPPEQTTTTTTTPADAEAKNKLDSKKGPVTSESANCDKPDTTTTENTKDTEKSNQEKDKTNQEEGEHSSKETETADAENINEQQKSPSESSATPVAVAESKDTDDKSAGKTDSNAPSNIKGRKVAPAVPPTMMPPAAMISPYGYGMGPPMLPPFGMQQPWMHHTGTQQPFYGNPPMNSNKAVARPTSQQGKSRFVLEQHLQEAKMGKKRHFDTAFTKNIKVLKAFKEECRGGDVKYKLMKQNTDEKYNELRAWTTKMLREIRLFEKSPKDEKCLLSTSQYRQLLDHNITLRTRTVEPSFDVMIAKLEEFKVKHGHCDVGTALKGVEHRHLRDWVDRMRAAYRKFKEGKRSDLDEEKIARLSFLGFKFVDPRAHITSNFHERSMQWLEYKTKHGADPKQNNEDGLGRWVDAVRRNYKQFKSGKKTRLTQKHVDRLVQWGFDFEGGNREKQRFATWDSRFEELVAYKEKNGNALVPMRMPGLGPWVKQQRRDYRLYTEGKGEQRVLNEERVAKLESVGFVFDASSYGAFKWKLKKQPERSIERLGTNANAEQDTYAI